MRAFVTLADERSFTRAARRLNLSQPALTVQIRNLETSFGGKLFDRDPRGVALTRVGNELAPRLRRLLSDLDGAMGEALGCGAGPARNDQDRRSAVLFGGPAADRRRTLSRR